MIFRTLLFFVVMYFLVKFISRLFLPSEAKKKKGPGAFYQTFQHFAEQSQQQNRNQRQSANGTQRFEEIEEAEFEDVTDDEKSTS